MLRSTRAIVDATLNGQELVTEFVKNPTQATTAGIWFDLTGSPGNPRAKQWFDATPLVAQAVRQSVDPGIYHGPDLGAARRKYLRTLRMYCSATTPLPLSLILCDFLLYYPTIEDGTTDPQVMDNTVTLPRYVTGDNVQILPVTIAGRTGGQTFTVEYTNSDGVAGRVTTAARQNLVSTPGTITTSIASGFSNSLPGPFLTLQGTDRGVRSIQSVTMQAADTGFFALVLVRPLANTSLNTPANTVYEKDLLLFANEMPIIEDDAFLSMLVLAQGSLSGVALRGSIRTVWN